MDYNEDFDNAPQPEETGADVMPMSEENGGIATQAMSADLAAVAGDGIVNGSDLLLAVAGLCIAYCTEHTCNYDTETKARAVKAPETVGINASKFDETTISKLAITISFKGLQNYEEGDASGFRKLLKLWYDAKPVQIECFNRAIKGAASEDRPSPYLIAQAVITKLSESNPAGDDATYDGELKVTGVPYKFTPDATTV